MHGPDQEAQFEGGVIAALADGTNLSSVMPALVAGIHVFKYELARISHRWFCRLAIWGWKGFGEAGFVPWRAGLWFGLAENESWALYHTG